MAGIILVISVIILVYCHYTDDPEQNYLYLKSVYGFSDNNEEVREDGNI